MITFAQPLLLLLLLPIGILVYLTWRNMSLPFPRPQRLLILVSRLLLFTLIICALAGAAIVQPVTRQSVVFVGDISASTASQRAFMEQWITNAIKHKRPEDQVGIVAVGRNALVEQSVKSDIDFSHFESTPDTNYTDLASGLRLAAAILPTDTQRRIVLLSDGQQNTGDALQEAQLLQQEGIRLDVVPLPTLTGADARIDELIAPTNLHTNERFTLHATLFSNVAQAVQLHLYLDHTQLAQIPMHLLAGSQEISLTMPAPPAGFHTLRLTMDASQDSIPQNNEAAVFLNVQGPPHVLVIEGKPGEGQNIIAALQAAKIQVTAGSPNDVPTTLDGLAGYSAVVLANVPAVLLGNARMQILQSFVRDLGRGLVVSGGQNSYGVGGYAGTPLEQTLPVKMDIPQHKDTPSIAVVLIVESLENEAEVNISKEAAKGVISLLTPRDQVAISEGCGGLISPMQYVTNKAAIMHTIDSMQPCDPGSYNPDFFAAEQALLKTNAKIKHVILLGDGDAYDNYAPQILKMANENISVSTVETNADTYQDLATMQQIAEWGKGRFYQADNPATIPQVLLKETQQVARRAIINEPFVPAIVGNHPIMTGLGALPGLSGYVATTPKPAAQLVLISHKDDPVLAVWQYGLGRVAAWTSDAAGLWTTNWITWNEAVQWWANLVTWTLPAPDSALNINATTVGGTGKITVDLPPGTASNASGSQQMQASIITPDLARSNITLQPTAPGRWEGSFPAGQIGAYLLQVSWQASSKTEGTSRLSATTGLVVPYSPEYHTQGTDTRFLTLLAHTASGDILAADQTGAAFAPNLAPVSAELPIVFWLLALAALLLPVDIAVRRLASLEFLVVGYRWLVALLRPGGLQLAHAGTSASSSSIGETPLGNLRAKREERRSRVTPFQRPVIQQSERTPQTAPSSVPKKEATQSDTSMASRLLEAKHNRTKKTQ